MGLTNTLRYEPATRRVRASLDGQPVLEPRMPCCVGAAPGRADVRRAACGHRSHLVPWRRRGPTAPAAGARPSELRTTRRGRTTTWSSRADVHPRRFTPETPTSAAGSSSSGRRSRGSRSPGRSPVTRTTRSSGSTCSRATATSWSARVAPCWPTPATRSPCTRRTSRCGGTSPTTTSSPTSSSAARRRRPVRTRATRSTSRSPPAPCRGRPRGRGHRVDLHPPARRGRRDQGDGLLLPERTDLDLDGVSVPRPVTPWSSPRAQKPF